MTKKGNKDDAKRYSAGPEPSPSTAVVASMVDTADSAAEDLPPLYNAIDPDALDKIFHQDSEGEVRFSYNGYAVTVTSDATVSIEKADDDP